MKQMSIRALRSMVLVAGLGVGSVGCGSASNASAHMDGSKFVITWDGAGAGLYVTNPEAHAPTGYGEKVKGGTTYWAIEATAFPGGFSAPVTYGVVPDGAKDVTKDNGGPSGGVPLKEGTRYKITIQGFGGDPTVKEITWEPNAAEGPGV